MNNSKNKFVCRWSLEIVYGKQSEALEILKEWGEEKFKSSHFKVSQNRMMNGFVGESPSLIIDEYIFESMDDFEKHWEICHSLSSDNIRMLSRRS